MLQIALGLALFVAVWLMPPDLEWAIRADGSAVLAQTAQRPLEPGQEQNRPANSANAAQADQRGTEQSPIAIKLLNTGKSDAEAADEAKRISEKDQLDQWSAKWIVILTLALVTATVLQFGALLYQGY